MTFETPVDENDKADVDFIESRLHRLFPFMPDNALVLISSQVPVGFTAKIEKAFSKLRPKAKTAFSYSPENLQLGRAMQAFQQPQRIIVGTRTKTVPTFPETSSPTTML